MSRTAYLAACISLVALIFLGLAWELRLAPLHPGGSALVFKVLPLLLPLFGILHGKRYTYKWSSLLILFYFAEGVVRTTTEAPPARWLALAEIALAAIFFAAAVSYVRQTRRQ
ncbi:DUF2069 domain-containing protein [Azospira restricta]|uniref:DUF2069 domain-containing protein n=1 Tax=Azospira restricta TaxID=404405 RepID=A0A974PXU8_9RHOO|nr:DUF2069 domain-containing protein [Azospira restricta]QRJ63452.1 DUF2069 domain-containing protein [Azospira restricta]